MGVLCCYFRPKMFTPVDHESAQLSRLEAVAVESPKSPESPDVNPHGSATPNTGTAHTRTQKFFTVPLDPQ